MKPLLMKFLDKFYNNTEIPWVTLTWTKFYSSIQTPPQARSPVGSFWWKHILKLFDRYQDLAVCNPNGGNTVLFWTDTWAGQPLKDKFPQLLSFTRKSKCSIRYLLDQEVDRIFSLPISSQAAAQLEEVENLLQARTWAENVNDSCSYSWGSPRFSSKKAYSTLIGITAASPLFKSLWASSNLGKHKFFLLSTPQG